VSPGAAEVPGAPLVGVAAPPLELEPHAVATMAMPADAVPTLRRARRLSFSWKPTGASMLMGSGVDAMGNSWNSLRDVGTGLRM
jgi:hypothetical protein